MTAHAAGDDVSRALQAQVMPFLRRLLVNAPAGRSRVQNDGIGVHLSPRIGGTGSEFADHRPYQAGDDLRQVNARLWARLGRPMVRQYQQERARSFLVVVDRSASMSLGVPRKWDQAWPLASAVVCAAAGNHDAFAVLVANEDSATVIKNNPLATAETLATTDIGGRTNLAATASAIVASRFDANTEVVWVSDFLDRAGIEPALARLRRVRCTPLLVCTPDVAVSAGAKPRTAGELVRLRDVETGEIAFVPMTSERLRHHAATLAAYYGTLARFCAHTRVPFLRAGARFEINAHHLLRAAGLRA
ncbi:MAG: DUF58 domain-containing protein [Deltaproteobacteria bacterium]|nr:DUF58 domain-containing protein [Deltaproteobacteria bacterium]